MFFQISGILTRRDISCAVDSKQLVKDLMTPKEKMLNIENITHDHMPTAEDIIQKMKEKRVEKIVLLGINKFKIKMYVLFLFINVRNLNK